MRARVRAAEAAGLAEGLALELTALATWLQQTETAQMWQFDTAVVACGRIVANLRAGAEAVGRIEAKAWAEAAAAGAGTDAPRAAA